MSYAKRSVLIAVAALAATFLLSGCDRTPAQSGGNTAKPKGTTVAPLPAGLLVNVEPANAKGVEAVKADAAVGREVVLRGRIGGRVEPFVAERAVFIVADPDMATCKDLHGDGCPTPWDYCCEPKDHLLAATATLRIVGPDGQPLKLNLRGQHGLDPLALVTVAGKVSQMDEGGIVVDASALWVKTQ